jgi:hypothetical protein
MYMIAKASGSEDLLSRSPVHASAQDGVDYDSDARSEQQNLDRFQGVCGSSRARVYIDTAEENPSNVGHDHIARSSRLQQPRSGSDPNRLAVIRPSKTRFSLSSKRISSARGSIANRDARASWCDKSSQDETSEEEDDL